MSSQTDRQDLNDLLEENRELRSKLSKFSGNDLKHLEKKIESLKRELNLKDIQIFNQEEMLNRRSALDAKQIKSALFEDNVKLANMKVRAEEERDMLIEENSKLVELLNTKMEEIKSLKEH